MTITVNGRERVTREDLTIQQLLEDLGLAPAHVVVELNRHILAQDQFSRILLKTGDMLEIVQFVGGG
ncbi:sulfur carrier protein ThiS [Pelobacter seleniigenes]|uniref:sulfur carrier protein ThiS n=1 Tax=Pelobacter seleniigenes TaxID=407188 RepID=UPI0004A73D22|nr:sulfur carrier protein ThiS [Pelobacter seleniigenes]